MVVGLSSILNRAAGALANRATQSKQPSAPTQTQSQTQMPSQYSGSGNPYNEILYNKKLYEDPNASQGQRQWASSQAQQYYGMLNDVDRQRFQNMNASAMENY